MNKYQKIGFACLAGLSILSSCDVMDTEPFETYSEDLVWSSKETVDAFVIETYPGTIANNFAGGCGSWESLTPNGAQCDQVGNSINTKATETGIDAYTDYGFGRFGEQRRCNMVLEKVAESTVLTELQKKELTAEAHYLRGALWFDMTRKMGRFVPIDKVLDQNDTEAFKTPATASVEESYRLVMEELDLAVEGLPETSDQGRANRYAALALRSRAALQAYAYTKDSKYLDVVINSSNEVINSGQYTLADNYGDIFDENSPNDNEIILARYYLDKDATVGSFEEMILALPNLPGDDVKNGSSNGENTLDPNVKTFDGWGMYWPTQDLVDQYLAIDEKTGEAKVWYETSQYLDNIETIPSEGLGLGGIEVFKRFDGETRNLPTANDLITGRTDYPLFKQVGKVKSSSNRTVTDIMYNNRDKRMDATVIRDMSEFWGLTMTLNMGGNASQGVRSKEDGGWYTTTTGYYWRKNTVKPDPRAFASVKINFHYVIARLGEMYMNMAEAYLLKGDVTKAVEMLNVTRVKHGGLPPSNAATLNDAWTDYLRERRVEMAYENGDIYFSYLRWGKYGGASNYGRASGDVIKDLNAPVYKIGITSDRKSFCVGQLTLLNSWNRNFTTRRYLFPIPQGAIDKRAADGIIDKQNEGW